MWDITVLRAEPGQEDDYGNPTDGAEAVSSTFRALFAPSNSEEQTEPGRNAVLTGGTVYKRGTPPDVQPHDHVLVEGVRYAVDGILGVWRNQTGRTIGSQFGLKAVSG